MSDTTFIPDGDPALPALPLTRVRYAYGMLLGADDFNDEQRYHVLGSRAHSALLHGHGTLRGLRVVGERPVPGDAGDRIRVKVGIAADPLGRMLYLRRDQCLDLVHVPDSAWQALRTADGEEPDDDEADRVGVIVIRYRPCAVDEAPALRAPCGDAFDDGLTWSRLRDDVRLELLPDPGGSVWRGDAEGGPLPGEPVSALADDGSDPLDPGSEDPSFEARNPLPDATWLDHLRNALMGDASHTRRLWADGEEVGLVLARVQLGVVGGARRVQRVDNAVRSLLPDVQTLVRHLAGFDLRHPEEGAARLQIREITHATDGGAGTMTWTVTHAGAQPVLQAAGVRAAWLLPDGTWVDAPAVLPAVVDAETFTVTADVAAGNPTHARLELLGTGPGPLLGADGVLSGWIDQPAPARGEGRDVTIIHPWPH